MTYALDESRKTIARASFSRYAGQLETGTVGVTNPSSTAGSATYRWVDTNGDHFAQASEVNLTQFITAAGGFNPAAPTAVTSANVLDPNLKAPKTSSIVAGVERELRPNLAVNVNYSYTRTSDLFGNFTGRITPRVGVTLADYAPGSGFSGRCPTARRTTWPTFIPNAAKVTAGGNGFTTTNIPDYCDRLPRPRAEPGEAAVEPVDGARRVLVEQRARALRQRGRHLRHERQPDADAERAAEGRRPIRAAERRQRRGQHLHQREMADQRQRDVPGAVRDRGQRQRVRAAGISAIRSSGRGRRRRSAATRRSRF